MDTSTTIHARWYDITAAWPAAKVLGFLATARSILPRWVLLWLLLFKPTKLPSLLPTVWFFRTQVSALASYGEVLWRGVLRPDPARTRSPFLLCKHEVRGKHKKRGTVACTRKQVTSLNFYPGHIESLDWRYCLPFRYATKSVYVYCNTRQKMKIIKTACFGLVAFDHTDAAVTGELTRTQGKNCKITRAGINLCTQ